jgi:uncharacterized protein
VTVHQSEERLHCRGRGWQTIAYEPANVSVDERRRQKVESDIRDNPAMSRFEMPLGDGALAVAYYKIEDGRVVLLHTEVPQELSGLGYGSRLAHGVFEALRRDGKRVIAKCPFMSSYAARHPEYGVLLDG